MKAILVFLLSLAANQAWALDLSEFDFLSLYRNQNQFVMEVGRRAFEDKVPGQLHPSVVFHWIWIDLDRTHYNPQLKWLNEGPYSQAGFSAEASFRDFAGYRLEADANHAVFHELESGRTTSLQSIRPDELPSVVKDQVIALLNDFYLNSKKYKFSYDCAGLQINIDFIGRYLNEVGFVGTTNSHVLVTLQNSVVIGDGPIGPTASETGGIISGTYQSHQENVVNEMTLYRRLVEPSKYSAAEAYLGQGFESLRLPLSYRQDGEISFKDTKRTLNCTRSISEEVLNTWLLENY